jgi:hypothetical protein
MAICTKVSSFFVPLLNPFILNCYQHRRRRQRQIGQAAVKFAAL